MASLHEAGWRQGSILTASLPLVGVRVTAIGDVAPDTQTHDRWIVATQDCDLALVDASHADDVVELRPVFSHDPPAARGIRSRKCLLTDGQYVEAQSRRTMISPAALTALLAAGAVRDNSVADDLERKTEFKTWLGYRYDRPAVPPDFVPLADAIAKAVERQGKRYSDKVRDILVQFEPGNPPVFYLFAVIMDEHDSEEVQEWLTAALLNVPDNLGVLGDVQVATADHVPLALIETSFAASTTQITWSGKGLRGQPGRLSRPVQSP